MVQHVYELLLIYELRNQERIRTKKEAHNWFVIATFSIVIHSALRMSCGVLLIIVLYEISGV